MPIPSESEPAPAGAATASSWREVESLVQRHRPRRVLLIGPREGMPQLDGQWRDTWRVWLTGAGSTADGDLRCALEQLPIADRAFDLVIVREVLSDGREAWLAELLRVINGGGRLLVWGPGRWSLTRRRASGPVPRPGPLCRRLEARSFVIESCHGWGLAGARRCAPWRWPRGLAGLGDQVLICARRHESRPLARPLRFARPHPAGAGPATLEGVNREAVA